jgi:peptide chain release factor 1
MEIEQNKVILEVRAGTGGDEASLFAGELARMYQKFAAKRGWRFTVLDTSESSTKGYKTFIASVAGEGVYRALKNESGVHRVQRVPATERSGRIHTSTASVVVFPEVASQEIAISPQDLEVSFFRSSGPGGQNVNKVETAVRIRHIPSGIVVAAQTERSQSANREQAMTVLRSKLFEFEEQEKAAAKRGLRREQIGGAERAEKIRTYNFPQDRITDHRIGKKWSNIERMLEGGLEPIVRAFIDNAEKRD